MTQAIDGARALNRLLKRISRVEPPAVHDPADPIASIVFSFLLWEAGLSRAQAAFRRLRETVVDFNDLRVCLPHETIATIGERYPLAQERCQRLRATLNDIYIREHAVSLDRMQSQPKRDVKKYIDSLEGMVPYVSTRVGLVTFEIHGVPVDELLRRGLITAGIAEEATNLEELSGWLNRQIPAGEALAAHWALETWVSKRDSSSESGRGTSRKSGSRKTTRSSGAARGRRSGTRSGSKSGRKSSGRTAAAS